MNIALIPAKSFSRRIPNKNFMDFCDKPLVLWSIDQALDSKLIDKVVVSTDSNYFRGSLPMSTKRINLDRPKSLCTDTTTQEEVIAHAIEVLNLNGNDNIVLLQPTSPLRLPGDIDNCIKRQTSFSLNSVISVTNDNEPFFFDQKGYRYELDGTAQRENGSIYVIPIRSFKAWNILISML